MYTSFFGLREKPFKLVPDPAFLYLGPSHEDALAHLQYAISQGEGFMVITGEVGTGKTTLCRAYLNDLPEDTRAAFIFNPKLDAVQLLQSINSEFGIADDAETLRYLMDELNAFLLGNKSKGRNAILLIDEAQNLSADVLEQIRLLSNLETTREKLLQIILVGQPELRDLLETHDLRQLSQRISLRYHLSPLTREQTRAYIEHRLGVAARKPFMPFTSAAVEAVYRYAGGVPRLINIACDRVLLKAFNIEKKQISGTLAREAVSELTAKVPRSGPAGGDEAPPMRRRSFFPMLAAFTVVVLLVAAGLVLMPRFMPAEHSTVEPATQSAVSHEDSGPTEAPAAVDTVDAVQPVEIALNDLLSEVQGDDSRALATQALLGVWQSETALDTLTDLDALANDDMFFQVAAAGSGLQVHLVGHDLWRVSRLNHPAVLRFQASPETRPIYLALVALGEDEAVLGSGGDLYRVTVRSLMEEWQGSAFLFWKDMMNLSGTIPYDAPQASVVSLKMMLNQTGLAKLALTDQYDDDTRAAVVRFQTQVGLPPDGVVGPETQIALYQKTMADRLPAIDRRFLSEAVQ